jgi:hypothetical protein
MTEGFSTHERGVSVDDVPEEEWEQEEEQEEEEEETCWYCRPSLLTNGIGLDYDIPAFCALPAFKFLGSYGDGSAFSRRISDLADSMLHARPGGNCEDLNIPNPHSGTHQRIRIHQVGECYPRRNA